MSYSYVHFGLIVTGETEEQYLPKLFRSLAETGICHFEVIRRIGQRSPIISPTRRLEMVGSGKRIPNKDAEEIGFPARSYLSTECRFVVLVDDLEYDRRENAQQVYDRYRKAFNTILPDGKRHQAAVHFLVYMLEAYYFADAAAINDVLELNPPLSDYEGDVETIRNPKSGLRQLYEGFNEIEDGGKILERINIKHVLEHPETCKWLRTLFAWCVQGLQRSMIDDYEDICSNLAGQYQLREGELSSITRVQLDGGRREQ